LEPVIEDAFLWELVIDIMLGGHFELGLGTSAVINVVVLVVMV